MENDQIYCMKYGEKYPIQVTMNNTDAGTPINLTGAQIRVTIKDELSDEQALISKTITESSDITTVGKITAPTQGTFVIKINDSDFALLKKERVYYMTIWWDITAENFSKVVSSNCSSNLRFIVHYA